MEFGLIKVFYALIALSFIVVFGLMIQALMQKIGARVAGRRGIPIYQYFIDIIKNYGKRTTISHGMMFFLGPIFRLTGGIGVFLFIPVVFGSHVFANFSFSGDLILVLYFMFFGSLGMALGAGEGGHPYSGIGIGRGLSQMTASEVPFTLAILSIALQYNTLSVTEIVAAQQGSVLNWTVFTNPFAVIAGMLAVLGGYMRNPFSVVLAPQEIPIGPPTEMHSQFLGLLQTNRAILPIAKTMLLANLFFGGATNLLIMMLKVFLIYFWPVFVGVVYPRMRIDQSIRWFLKWPLLIGIISVIHIVYF